MTTEQLMAFQWGHSSHAERAEYVNQYRPSGQSSAPVIENSFFSFFSFQYFLNTIPLTKMLQDKQMTTNAQLSCRNFHVQYLFSVFVQDVQFHVHSFLQIFFAWHTLSF